MLATSILQADPVVQAVIGILLSGSVASWAIVIQKILALSQLRRVIDRIEAYAQGGGGVPPNLLVRMLDARDAEAGGLGGDPRPLRAAAMRSVYTAELRRQDSGLPFLATLASTAPFIGLFGTVWGIMRSFSAIGASNDTSLAVVAPGIAEALFATAIGLAVAIPAVAAFNLVRAALRRCGHRLAEATIRLSQAAPEGRPGPG